MSSTSGEMIAARCPRCGASLLTDGLVEWCSFVGGGAAQSCRYGIDRAVALNPTLRAAAEAGRAAYWTYRHDAPPSAWADADPVSRKQWTYIAAEMLRVLRRQGG